MRALGIDTADLGVEMTTRKILDVEGRTVVEADCPQTLTAWERLYRILRDAFPAEHYHRGVGLKGFEQTGRSVVAHFSDGRSVEADLLIGADGIRSTVRQQLLPDLNPLYAGYVAWRALLPEQAIPPAIHRELFESMTFCLPPGEQFLELSGRRSRQRSAPGASPSQRDLVSPGRRRAPNCNACSPTRAASRIRSRSRRR